MAGYRKRQGIGRGRCKIQTRTYETRTNEEAMHVTSCIECLSIDRIQLDIEHNHAKMGKITVVRCISFTDIPKQL